MDKTKRKARVTDLSDELLRSNSREADMIKELVRLLIDDAKDSLVTFEGDGMHRQQGEARALIRLYELVTKPSPISRG